MHIDDLRALAPMWLSKTEDVREDRAHWATNITGDIYGKGWISEMYGYSFGAAEVRLHHKINDNLMIYPGYIPREDVEPILFHYGFPFSVGNWSFNKLDHHEDAIVYDCGRLFSEPPYPREVKAMEADPNKRRALFLNIECINTLNEGLLLHHVANGCPKPKWSKYLSFLKSKTFSELTRPKFPTRDSLRTKEDELQEQVFDEPRRPYPKIHTIFSTECTPYFDWQTMGLVHSFHLSGQPGNITRLLSCTDEDLKHYGGHDLAPTHYVPSMSRHPLTGDWFVFRLNLVLPVQGSKGYCKYSNGFPKFIKSEGALGYAYEVIQGNCSSVGTSDSISLIKVVAASFAGSRILFPNSCLAALGFPNLLSG
ncbi:Peptidyl serine alpha-galactosyltransferase [Sarracenia purpurea var. burkii]